MEKYLGNVEIYPPSPVPIDQQQQPRREGMVTWVIIVIQFVIIIALMLGVFSYFMTKTDDCDSSYSTRTYQNFELQTLSPSNSPLTFRRRYKTTSAAPQTIDIDFSEDIAPMIETTTTPHTTLLEVETENSIEHYEHELLRAAVYSQNTVCSEIGKSILVRGGNAVDSAIATSFCLMAASPHKASIGGGVAILIKDTNGNITTVNARETVPLNINLAELRKNPDLASSGSKSAATPGTINGLYRAYQKYSSDKVEWKHLIIPTIQQCVKGFDISNDLAEAIKIPMIKSSIFMKKNIQNNRLYCNSLAATLTEITEYESPLDGFYHGEMAQKMTRELNGYVNMADFEDYESDVNQAMCSDIDNDMKLCGPGPPSLFPVLANTYLYTKNMSNLQKVNEITESSMHLAAKITDPMFSKTSRKYAEDLVRSSKRNEEKKDIHVDFNENGSTEVFVIDENNMTVSVVLSLGDLFGSAVYSSSGFFWNNKLKYFDLKHDNLPLSLQPGKVPTSKVSPIIVMKNNTILSVSGSQDFISLIHLLRDITHRNYDASKVSPALFVQNSAIVLKSNSNKNLYSITGY